MKSFRLDNFIENDEGGAAEEGEASQALQQTLQKQQQPEGAPAEAAAAASAAAPAAADGAGDEDEEGYQDEHICIRVVARHGFTCAIQASARLGMPPRALFKQIITHPGWPACLPAVFPYSCCMMPVRLQE
jgi:hypothetical protein